MPDVHYFRATTLTINSNGYSSNIFNFVYFLFVFLLPFLNTVIRYSLEVFLSNGYTFKMLSLGSVVVRASDS